MSDLFRVCLMILLSIARQHAAAAAASVDIPLLLSLSLVIFAAAHLHPPHMTPLTPVLHLNDAVLWESS